VRLCISVPQSSCSSDNSQIETKKCENDAKSSETVPVTFLPPFSLSRIPLVSQDTTWLLLIDRPITNHDYSTCFFEINIYVFIVVHSRLTGIAAKKDGLCWIIHVSVLSAIVDGTTLLFKAINHVLFFGSRARRWVSVRILRDFFSFPQERAFSYVPVWPWVASALHL
jgi:hypothetical protein